MSELHLAQIRRHLEQQFLDHVDQTGASQEHHLLSRGLAALALTLRTGLPAAASARCVTDHTRDCGIDGIAYAADRSTLVIVQSKWTDSNIGIAEADVLKFVEGVRLLVNNDWSAFDGPILGRRVDIEDLLFQAGTRIELVLASSGTPELADPQTAALTNFCTAMNDSTEIASFLLLNQQKLHRAIAASRQAQINLTVNLRNWGTHQDGACAAYYGTVSAQEVIKWYEDHGDLLFSRNIRGALVATDVNDAITTTARDDPSRFWFFNNGITVIAETFQQAPYVNQKSGIFEFRSASVVNGAQTVSSLVRAAKDAPQLLASADIFVRFVTVDDPDGDFARLVTRRTNTQNRVGGREFVALDPEQERLRTEFAVSGLRYAYRSGESMPEPTKGCDLSDATIALACAHGLNEAVLAKREISRLWDDTSRPPYRALFNPSVSASQVWMAVEIMRWVDKALDEARRELEGRDQLIAVHGNRVVLWAVMQHVRLTEQTSKDAFKVPFEEAAIRKLATSATSDLVSIVNDGYKDSYPQPLFKNQSKCKDVGAQLLFALQSAAP